MGLTLIGSPSVAVNSVGTTATVTSGSFTPAPPTLMLALWVCNTQTGLNPTAPSISDNLASHAIWATVDWMSRADAPNRDGQAASFRGWAPLNTSMTATVTTGAPSGSRESAVALMPIRGVDWYNPIGAHAEGAQTSGTTLTVNYKATRDGSWGFLAICDWDVAGPMTGGSGVTMVGSANISTAITYGIARRSNPDGVKGQTTTFAITLGGNSTNISWVVVEVLPELAISPSRRNPYSPLWRPGQPERPIGRVIFTETATTSGQVVVGVPADLLFAGVAGVPQWQVVGGVAGLSFAGVPGSPQAQVVGAPASIVLVGTGGLPSPIVAGAPAPIVLTGVAGTPIPSVPGVPAALVLSGVSGLTVPQLAAQPATLTFTGVAALPQAQVVGVPAVLSLSGVAGSPSPIVNGGPASLVLSGVAASPVAGLGGVPANLVLTGVPGFPQAQIVGFPATIALTGVAGVPQRRVDGVPGVMSFTAVPAIFSIRIFGVPASITFEGVPGELPNAITNRWPPDVVVRLVRPTVTAPMGGVVNVRLGRTVVRVNGARPIVIVRWNDDGTGGP